MQARQPATGRIEFDLRCGEVNSLNPLGATLDSRKHLSQRSNSCVGVNRSSSDIRQEGMKYHVVFAIEQQNLALGTAQLVAEGFCKLYGCKSSTNNDDSYFLIISLRQWYSP